jgi:hypothetical protein
VDEKPGPGKTLAKMRVTPVILSVVHEDDRQMRINGYSARGVRKHRVARILREAYAQNHMMPFGPQAYPIKIVGWPFLLG